MRNPFVAIAMAVVAARQVFQSQQIANFNKGMCMEQLRSTRFAKKTGLTVAAAKRNARKARNQSRNRIACRG